MNTSKRYERIAFVASPSVEAQAALVQLTDEYGNCDPQAADVIVALGGDGLMLQTLHEHMRTGKPIYGMHRGTVGFLMNEFSQHELRARLGKAGAERARRPAHEELGLRPRRQRTLKPSPVRRPMSFVSPITKRIATSMNPTTLARSMTENGIGRPSEK